MTAPTKITDAAWAWLPQGCKRTSGGQRQIRWCGEWVAVRVVPGKAA